MGNRILKVLEDERRKQSIPELKRKYNKAIGRHSKNYWIVEEIDLANAEAKEICKKIGWS